MSIQVPIVWGTILFLFGLILGQQCPSILYLPAAVAALVTGTLLRQHRRIIVISTIIFWFLLGCSRMSLSVLSPQREANPAMVNLRQNAKEKVHQLIRRMESVGLRDAEALSLTSAMLLGERQGLRREVKSAYSRTGTAHLLALSGLHLGVLYSLFHLLLLRWVRTTRWRWHALPLVLILLWGYALLTGFPVSLIRASAMLSIFTIATVAQRSQPSVHSLAAAALLILLFQPTAVTDVSFMLSFTSVFFILRLYSPLYNHYRHLFGGWRWLLKPLGVTLAAQIGTAPLVMYSFHIFPVGAPLINLLLIPFTTGIIYTGLVTILWPQPLLVKALTMLTKGQISLIAWWNEFPTLLSGIYIKEWAVVLFYLLLLVATEALPHFLDRDWPVRVKVL